MQAMTLPPAVAAAQALTVLHANPRDPQARLVVAAALMRQQKWTEARGILEALAQDQPQMEAAWRSLGQVLARAGERAAAVAAFERALDLEIRGKDAWFELGTLLAIPEKGDDACGEVVQIEQALSDDRLDAADLLSRMLLESSPGAPRALRLRADVLIRTSRWPDARRLLECALDIAPASFSARLRYATMLFVHGEYRQSLPQFERLLGAGCEMALLRGAHAWALASAGQYARAIETFEAFIETNRSNPGLWQEYGRVLRLAGDRRMSMAFRQAIELLPSLYSAWYALATVKSFRWDETLVHQISAQLARPDLAIDDRSLIHFVLGKAFEHLGRNAEAFGNFRVGKAIFRDISGYEPRHSQTAWRRTRLLFKPPFLRRRAGTGAPAPDPIFIVGLPRAGSTLIEQIISAHSQVEGLGEVSALPALVENLYAKAGGPQHWPLLLGRLDPAELRALGEEYLRSAGILRKSGAPFFTDKQPGNFQLSGLIHLVLPNAKIVDVRRHPLDCGVSCFRHYFPAGHRFACDLGDIGIRYAEYVRLMAHFDEVLPGKVYRVVYERLVDDLEGEVRRLFAYLGLPFEQQCLRFFENRRPVMTLSYEQVFTPLYRSGIGQWRRYEPWLQPLKDGLGCVLEAYPDVPKYFPEVHATSRAPRVLGGAGGAFASINGVRQRPFLNAAA